MLDAILNTDYDVEDWYWFIGGDNTRVFSSRVRSYVPLTNSAYVQFVAEGKYATKIDTRANLRKVINEPIRAQLRELDFKSIRPIREKDDTQISAHEAEAIALRATLMQ